MNSVARHQVLVPEVRWRNLGHVYVFGNGKGGVGKTTSSCHFGAFAAMVGAPTLLIDLNGQGNVATLLGFSGTEQDDGGRNLFSAVTMGAPLTPVKGVRKNLDVVPGGPFVRKINPVMTAEMATPDGAKRALLALADAVQKISSQYQVIVIDTPPENAQLLRLALCTARFVVIPMLTNMLSRTGLFEIAGDIRDMRDLNPYLTLLAVFIYGSDSRSELIRKEFREEVVEDLGSNSDALLEQYIRHSEAVAKQMPKFGLLAHELEDAMPGNRKRISKTTMPVAEDFDKLCRAIFERATNQQAKMTSEGVWP
ncbi:chromosome partitioning ATPase [Mycobacteroides abscessus subsp. abscessus]|uniref:ParA family protein n=1 Tax=Mycobacteroides abscessus TaxID=36809 RepID=UPI0009A7E475|nr:ParA family protein [Mycobacteroides abscessus]SLI00739.1 chromosome partitioning ATPase [Mycobacteroides abscessus subsp. abscessus]